MNLDHVRAYVRARLGEEFLLEKAELEEEVQAAVELAKQLPYPWDGPTSDDMVILVLALVDARKRERASV